jgi:hypothetical protein
MTVAATTDTDVCPDDGAVALCREHAFNWFEVRPDDTVRPVAD